MILGYLGALLVGVTLGLLGGGGSILTVPILVYLLAINPVTATAYSLFVVGTTSLVGAIRNMTKGMVDLKVAAVFAVPAFVAVYLTRRLITKDLGIMLFFAVIMLVASYSMIKGRKESKFSQPVDLNYFLITVEGIVVGVLTGIVGAGGGFLIIPDIYWH